MFYSRNRSQSAPNFGSPRLTSFQTLKGVDRSNEAAPKFEILLAHGCLAPRAQRLQRRLRRSAGSIVEQLETQIGSCRVHIFAFDAAKLLHRGQSTLNDIVGDLLLDIKGFESQTPLVVIAHNVAAWVVREALTQSQYESELAKVPVGIIDFGLPHGLHHDYWKDEKHWDTLRDNLLKYFDKGFMNSTSKLSSKPPVQWSRHLKKKNAVLTASIIQQIMEDFMRFREALRYPEKSLPIYSVCCPGEKGVDRKDSSDSQKSISSASPVDGPETMFVGMSSEEEEEIISLCKGASNNEPALIPASTKRIIFPGATRKTASDQTLLELQPSVHSSSRTQYYGSLNAMDVKPFHIRRSSLPTSEEHSGRAQSLEGASISKSPFNPFDPFPRVESLPPMTDVPLCAVPTKPNARVDSTAIRYQGQGATAIVEGHLHGSSVDNNFSESVDLQQSKEIASAYMQNGYLAEANKLYGLMIQYCEDHGRLDRSYYRMRLQVGQIHYIRGEYRNSEEKLRVLLEKQCDISQESSTEATFTSEIAKWLALSQWRRGDYINAQDTLETCMKKLPGGCRNGASLSSTLSLVLASAGAFKRAWALSKQTTNPENFRGTNGFKERDKDLLSARKGSFLINHARVSYAVGEFEEALECNRKALEDFKTRFGPKHFVTLDAVGLEAQLCLAGSQTSQAAETVRGALRDIFRCLGATHPFSLETLETLVLVYMSDGRYSDAEATATYLLDQNVEKLGETHPQTLKSKTTLAEIMLACGKWMDAEKTQKEVVQIQGGPDARTDHLGLFSYKIALANILRENGKWDEARELSLQVLAEELIKFGNEKDIEEATASEEHSPLNRLPQDHYIDMIWLSNLFASSKPMRALLDKLPLNPLTNSQPLKMYPPILQALRSLALCEQSRDDADLVFAHGIFEMITQIRSSRLGTDHRFTVDAQYDLAINYRLRGEFQKSLTIIKDVVNNRQKSLGSNHPEYLSAKYQEAVALFRLGAWKQALEKQRKVLADQSFILGKTHPDTVTSRFTLGSICHSMGRLNEAEQLLSDVIIAQEARYGDIHPMVSRSRGRRAFVRADAGNIQGAEEDQNIVVKERQKYPKGHYLLRNALSDQAQIAQTAGRLDMALSLYLDLKDSLPRHQRHTLGYGVVSNLGSCYYGLGNFLKAEEYQREIYTALKRSSTRSNNAKRLISSTFNLALTVKQTPGRYEEACSLLSEAVQRADEILTVEHPQSKELRVRLEIWQREKEQKLL